MRKKTVLSTGLFLLAALFGHQDAAKAQEGPDLAGGWIVTSWTFPDGEVISEPQRGLFLFTATGQYSIMYVRGTEPRPQYEGESQTDEETLASYGTITANSGRYTVEGDQLMYEAYVAKDPNYMADWNAAEPGNGVNLKFSITDGVLSLEWVDGRSAGLKATLRRPGQG